MIVAILVCFWQKSLTHKVISPRNMYREENALAHSSISFSLIVAPVAIILAPSKTVVQGQSVSFDCDATGTPPITFEWRDKSNTVIASNSHYAVNATTGVLTINSTVYNRDHGPLSCYAINEAIVDNSQQRSQATANLNVQGNKSVFSTKLSSVVISIALLFSLLLVTT